MQVSYKNTRQQEFCSLLQTMVDLKFRPADVARMLKKTHGAVSQYKSGAINPSETVLELFRSIVERHTKPEKVAEITEVALREQLSDLRRYSPDDYEVVKTTISLLHKKLPMVLEVSSPATGKDILSIASSSGKKHLEKMRSKKKQSEETSGRKSPSTGFVPPSSNRESAPSDHGQEKPGAT
jgi:predicted transcriptional regulator